MSEEVRTSSGIPIPAVPRPGSPDERYRASLGDPGEFPFARGIHPRMYRDRLWTMRQYAGYGTTTETNARFRALLARGQTGLSVAFDLPTQMGLDADHPRAEGEVGKSGVSISTVADMERLLDGIPLAEVSISMTINSTAAVLLGLLAAVARRRGTAWTGLRGTVQNDILKEYAARGTYVYPPGPSMRLATDLVVWSLDALPQWNPVSVSGYHMREAGATAVQEVAFTLGNGCAYLAAAAARGVPAERVARRISFFFASMNHLFEEVAKFRAARRLWARLVRDRFGVRDPEAQRLRFHTQTGGSTLAAKAPELNVVRVAVQALAAVLGGTQSLHTNSRDEALGLPTEEAAALALRTQQVLAHESGVAHAADPLGGSWLVEGLTDELEARARELLGKVEGMGGAERAIERGFYQEEIARSAYEAHRRLESGEDVQVGVTRFADPFDSRSALAQGERGARGRTRIPVLKVPESVRTRRARDLKDWRRKRDGAATAAGLRALGAAARGDGNLLPPIVSALESGATLGEVSDALREVFGEHRPMGGAGTAGGPGAA
ncbi:MAG: methylmalonyl-CoA mutase family protein [Planctomycetales bacterium]|nr:methylmalonyl-CoA mutase family protein [Planctomycetales bacterium]